MGFRWPCYAGCPFLHDPKWLPVWGSLGSPDGLGKPLEEGGELVSCVSMKCWVKSSLPDPQVLPRLLRKHFHHPLPPEASQLGAAFFRGSGQGPPTPCCRQCVSEKRLLLSQNKDSNAPQKDCVLNQSELCIFPPIFWILKYLSWMTSASSMHEAGHSKPVLWDYQEGWPGEGGGRGFRVRGHVHLWLTRVDVWQKTP